ncbi:hypothetical protein LSTR_LSTR013147 [Laodelphax striatellus]|uniref:Uncharacterized protein n=1 Tax=Laodelphax striatellus TaxID=195883 RepID=A0A482XKX6_LAOST|nr:hypothetical protein LSTR_LSTR013147 [Laodelphax striatellus]
MKSFKPPRPPVSSAKKSCLTVLSPGKAAAYIQQRKEDDDMITAARLKLPKQHLLTTPVNTGEILQASPTASFQCK